MTIIVSVKINDGIVMASDSATTFDTIPSQQIYAHSNKIINLRKGFSIGAMVTGAGGIGSESIDTLLKDLRQRFSGQDAEHPDWELNRATFTVKEVADKTLQFLAQEKLPLVADEVWTSIRICGYSAGRPLSEVWDVDLQGRTARQPIQVQSESVFGIRWGGDYETLDRLLLGRSPTFMETLKKIGLTPEQAEAADALLISEHRSLLYLNAMPIQDAIDLARFLTETTIGFIRFCVGRSKTVGGPIEIATITKHEGFRWVQRKHFYPATLNIPAHKLEMG